MAKLIVTAVTVEGRTKREVARDYGVSSLLGAAARTAVSTRGSSGRSSHPRRPRCRNTITRVEEQLALAAINKVDKNIYDGTSDVIAEKDRRKQNQKDTNALLALYRLVVPLQAQSVMQRRSRQYGKPGTFAVDAAVRQAVDEASSKAADSHIKRFWKT